MLALIGLKKFRSSQKPNRIDGLEKKTRRLGAGPGVAGSVAELREFADGSRAGLGAQRRILGLEKHQIWVKLLIQIWITVFDREIYSYITVPTVGRPNLSYR